MKRETLEGVRAGDIVSVRKAMQSLSGMPGEELKALWGATIEGMVNQEQTAEGVENKCMLMALSFSISPVYTKEKELVGYAKKLNDEGLKGNLDMIDALADSSYDDASQTACVYEDLTALGMICSEKSLENVDKGKVKALVANGEQAYKHAISIGAAVATGILKGEGRQIAKRCLLNAALYGDEYSRKYAVEALAHFIDDYQLKKTLVALEEGGADEITVAASYSLRTIREKDEVETAKADLGTLSEIEYPDVTSPQRWYIDIVFDAVETVLTRINDSKKKQEVLVALKQLAAYGAAPGPMEELIDSHSLGMVKKNVENALIHALVHGDDRMVEDAKEGIRKSSSDRVIGILNKVADRERNGNGNLSDKGSMIRNLVAEMQKKKFGHSLPPPLPRRTPKPPRQKMLH